jgi:hypothetical protein
MACCGRAGAVEELRAKLMSELAAYWRVMLLMRDDEYLGINGPHPPAGCPAAARSVDGSGGVGSSGSLGGEGMSESRRALKQLLRRLAPKLEKLRAVHRYSGGFYGEYESAKKHVKFSIDRGVTAKPKTPEEARLLKQASTHAPAELVGRGFRGRIAP